MLKKLIAVLALSVCALAQSAQQTPTLSRNNTFTGTNQFNGPTSFTGGTTWGGTNNFATTFTKTLNGIRFADQFSGADIGAKVNAAFADCSNKCTVYIPAGTYSDSTTIAYPVATLGTAALWIDPAATITFTATAANSYFIDATGTGQSQVNFRIYGGGRIIGNGTCPSSCALIHMKAFQRAYIDGVRLEGMTNGDAIKNEGANTVEITNATIINSSNGLHNIAVTGPFSPNAIHVTGTLFAGNTNAAVYDDATGIAFGAGGGNTYDHNTFEDNGTTASTTTATWLAKSCVNCAFNNNYVENGVNTPKSAIIIGDTGTLTFNTDNILVLNNTFATAGSTQTILVQNGVQHQFIGNNEGATGQTNFLKSTGNANQLFVGLNSAGNLTASAYYATVGANDVLYSFGSTAPSTWFGTAGGVGFNSIAGLNNDLVIKERASSGGNIAAFNAFGGSTVASISNTGKATFNHGVVIAGGTEITAQTGTGGTAVMSSGPTVSSPVITTSWCPSGSTACQAKRATVCTTSTTQFSTCAVTVTWTTSFADANYTASCTADGTNVVAAIGNMGSKSGPSMAVNIINMTSGTAVSTGTVDCIAVHD